MNILSYTARRYVAISALAVLLSACATSRDIVEPKFATRNSPTSGIPVRIDEVVDARGFEVAPPEPSTPSLMDNQIHNESLRARAIARKRNAYGKALGDVLLPEGKSVSQLVQIAITNALEESGYRVVSSDDPDYLRAEPVRARIDKLWSWFQPGFWALTLASNYDITMSGSLPPFKDRARIVGEVEDSMQIATKNDWAIIVEKSLADFSSQLKNLLAKK